MAGWREHSYEELDAAQTMRNNEQTAWVATDKDDKEAAETIVIQ